MKIIEYSKGSITEVENVFKVVESGAQGPPGTIGKLTTLTNKPVVVPADLALIGDSAASFANKNSTWLQVINSVIRNALDLVYQPLSSALTKITEAGGLPLWDGAAWPGGGGEWEVVGVPRVMTGNAIELFTVGTDDVVKIIMDGIRYGGDGDSFPNISCSIDGGATYPSTNTWSSLENTSGVVTPHGQAGNNSASIWLYDGRSQRETADASIIFNGVTDAGGPTIAKEFTYAGHDIGSEIGSCRGAGVFETVGVVNKIKIASQGGNTMIAGTITLLKRTY